jgi:hypothetical protein
MDPNLVDRVRDASAGWADADTDDRRESLAEIIDQYLASEGDEESVFVVAGNLDDMPGGGPDATGYYDKGTDTIILDDSTLGNDDFEGALDSALHEALHAESYHETGETYPGAPDDEGGYTFTEDDIENFDPDQPTPAGYGAMVGDTLVIEAAEDGYPPGHQALDVEAEALAAEAMSQATGGSSASGVASSGGGSDAGESNTIIITEPLFEFDFSEPGP